MYTEPKVVNLWLQAIKANFSEHKLNSLKVGTCIQSQLLRAGLSLLNIFLWKMIE